MNVNLLVLMVKPYVKENVILTLNFYHKISSKTYIFLGDD